MAAENVSSDEVLKRLDYPSYFELTNMPLPEGRDSILDALRADNLIKRSENAQWNITNLGAVLFAKRLQDFSSLARKAVRLGRVDVSSLTSANAIFSSSEAERVWTSYSN